MHNMTRLPDSAHIHAPFDDHVFHFKNDQVILEKHQGKRWIRIVSPEFGPHLFRVTKVIGGHHREDFAGVEEGQSDPHTEHILPVSYMLETGLFRYKGYSVMDPERPGIKPGAIWNHACIFCHNTVPYFSTLLGALTEPVIKGYQGEMVDWLLPPKKRVQIVRTDSNSLRSALVDEIRYLKGSVESKKLDLRSLDKKAINLTFSKFNETHLLERGIGCESCHGGSLEHVQNPRRFVPSLEPQSLFLSVKAPLQAPNARHSDDIKRVCARCHQVLFTQYPWTWEGGFRSDSVPGGSHINSGEGRDMLLGKCEVTCTQCHDPHSHDDKTKMERLETQAGNLVCLSCHTKYQASEMLRNHSHHSPEGAGGLCMNCHMPMKNMSLDTRLSRYHRIGSPTDPVRVEKDRPLECALCHTDKSVVSLVDTMEKWWPHKYDRSILKKLYGDLVANSLEATLRMGKPHEKAIALYLAGKQSRVDLVPLITEELGDPYPLIRYYAENALVDLLHQSSPLDLHQETKFILRDAAEWFKKASH